MILYNIWDMLPSVTGVSGILDDEFNVDLHKIIKTSGVGNYISYRKIFNHNVGREISHYNVIHQNYIQSIIKYQLEPLN